MYKRYWMLTMTVSGFECTFMMHGTEEEIWAYMKSEFGETLRYIGITDRQYKDAKGLGMKCYLAPEI